MLNRLAFLTLLIGSAAIPMQTQPNYQSRTVQSIELKNCHTENEKLDLEESLIGISKSNQSKVHCNN